MKNKCKYCGQEFETENKNKKCCSTFCSRKYSAEVMRKNGKGFKRQYNINDYFLKNESKEKYYFLGLMASDGCINSSKTTAIISQSGDNGLELIKYIKRILNADYKILERQPPKGKKVYILSFRSKVLIEDLCFNNIVPRKTNNFTIPEYILCDLNKLKYFLIGYIDGDESIGVYKNMLVASFVCNNNMCRQLLSLNLFKKSVQCIKNNVVDIRFNGKNAIEFLDFLYEDIKVYKSYKYKKYQDYIKICLDISPKLKYYLLRKRIFSELNQNNSIDYQAYISGYNVSRKYLKTVEREWINIKENI